MRREFVAFCIILCGMASAFTPVFAVNSKAYSCVAPYDLSKDVAGFMTRISGVNFATSKIAGQFIKSQINKNANGKFKVSVDSYSVPDLKNGRFRGLEIRGKNVETQGVYFSSIDIETLCDFNYIVYDKENLKPVFREDFPMSFSVTFSESDLNNTMQAVGYSNLIGKLNGFGKKYSLYEIVSTKSRIKENKFIYAFDVIIPILGTSSKYTFALISDLTVEDGQVVMLNPQFMNNYAKISLSRLTKAFDYLNPFEYSLSVLENKNAKLSVRNVSIVNDKINISGIINIPKDVLTQHKE